MMFLNDLPRKGGASYPPDLDDVTSPKHPSFLGPPTKCSCDSVPIRQSKRRLLEGWLRSCRRSLESTAVHTTCALLAALAVCLGGVEVEIDDSVRCLEAQPPMVLADMNIALEMVTGIPESSPISTQTYALMVYLFTFAASILYHSRRNDEYRNPIAVASVLVGTTIPTVFGGSSLLCSAVRWSPMSLAIGFLLSAVVHDLARSRLKSGLKEVEEDQNVGAGNAGS